MNQNSTNNQNQIEKEAVEIQSPENQTTVTPNNAAENSNISKALCPEEERLAFLPKYLGNAFTSFEKRLYYFARQLIEGYNGGYWDFYSLSNGGFFCQCDSDYREPFVLHSPNGSSHQVSDETAGIVVCLIALSDLSFQCDKNQPECLNQVVTAFHALRDFAGEHVDSKLIFELID
jgi:hypothetical protein